MKRFNVFWPILNVLNLGFLFKQAALVSEQARQLEQIKIDVADDDQQKRQLLGKEFCAIVVDFF